MNKYLKIAIYISIFILLSLSSIYHLNKSTNFYTDQVLQEQKDCYEDVKKGVESGNLPNDILFAGTASPICSFPLAVYRYASQVNENIIVVRIGLIALFLFLFYRIDKLQEEIKHSK